jgi:hypothetical protein
MATTSSTTAVPQILTRSVVPMLSDGLDAGDILECYTLVRPAQFHNPMMPSASLTIHKVAIGLRYRPWKMTNDMADEATKIREITLEYGPQRMGASLTQESMPSVQLEKDDDAGNNIVNGTVARSFVTWENEGKVYYTTQIASTGYISAYYMASVTGAVLGKILEKAVDYPMLNANIRGRPRRYQPFVVVDGDDSQGEPSPGVGNDLERKVLLRSSSSTDFMHYMWATMAELGVNMHPILAPPTYEVQLVAKGVEKVKVGPPDWATQPAATFYELLFQCIEAKVTGDYSKYVKPTPSPTVGTAPSLAPSMGSEAPSAASVDSNSSIPEALPNYFEDAENADGDQGGRKRVLLADFQGGLEFREAHSPLNARRSIEGLHLDDNVTLAHNDSIVDANDISSGGLADLVETVESANQSDFLLNLTQRSANDTLGNTTIRSPQPTPPTMAPSVNFTFVPSTAPSVYKVNKMDTKSEVDQAQEAADQAKQAAAEAKDAAKTDVDSKAADAAQVAAQAAQKAADATSSAAAQAAIQALHSGDGSTMLSVISPCFSDPQFGIAVKVNDSVISHAYLYIDGSTYYKVNLAYPFMQVVPVEHRIPQPRDFGGPGSGLDFVDWALAWLLLLMTIFGVLLLVQQVFGGYVRLVEPLFNFQIWFFNPLRFEDIKGTLEEERKLSQAGNGQGRAYTFGLDVIPVSMGGHRILPVKFPTTSIFARTSKRDQRDDEYYKERTPLTESSDHQEGSEPGADLQEIEMTEATDLSSIRRNPPFVRYTSRGSDDSGELAPSPYHDNSDDGINSGVLVGNIELLENDHRIQENGVPTRFRRDPDLVELPNLKSSSKVAIPVGVKRNGSFSSIGGHTL